MKQLNSKHELNTQSFIDQQAEIIPKLMEAQVKDEFYIQLTCVNKRNQLTEELVSECFAVINGTDEYVIDALLKGFFRHPELGILFQNAAFTYFQTNDSVVKNN